MGGHVARTGAKKNSQKFLPENLKKTAHWET